MNDKILNARELAQVKRIAQNVDADFQALCKKKEQIAKLAQEAKQLQQGIDEMEAPVIRKTGGYTSTDIYEKQIIPQFNTDGTPKTDKDGRQIKITKWVLKYPDTIVPVGLPNDFDAPVEEGTVANTQNLAGSDFDLDSNI